MEIKNKSRNEIEIEELNSQIVTLSCEQVELSNEEEMPMRTFPNAKFFQSNSYMGNVLLETESKLAKLRGRLHELTDSYTKKRNWNQQLLTEIGQLSHQALGEKALFIDALNLEEIEKLTGKMTLKFDDGRVFTGELLEGKVIRGVMTFPPNGNVGHVTYETTDQIGFDLKNLI